MEELRLLIVEDDDNDAQLLALQLRREGFSLRVWRAQNEAEFLARLHENPEVILCDYALPQFGPMRALELLRARSLAVPLIVVSGAIEDEQAIECIRAGAADYLLKDRLARLPDALRRALAEARLVREKRRVEEALRVRVMQQSALVQIGYLALSDTAISAVLDDCADQVVRTLDVDCGAVWLAGDDGSTLLLQAGVGWKDGRVGVLRVPATAGSHAGATYVSCEPILIEDFAQSAFPADTLVRDHRVRSGAAVLVLGEGRPLGVLAAYSHRARRFSADDLYFIQASANVLSQAIARRAAAERLRCASPAAS